MPSAERDVFTLKHVLPLRFRHKLRFYQLAAIQRRKRSHYGFFYNSLHISTYNIKLKTGLEILFCLHLKDVIDIYWLSGPVQVMLVYFRQLEYIL